MRSWTMTFFCIVACGNGTDVADAGSASMGGTSSGAGTTGADGPSTGDAEGESDGHGTDGESCEVYADASDIGPAVEIVVRNESDRPIYWVPRDCGGGLGVDVTVEDGRSFPHQYAPGCHPTTCGSFLSVGECWVGCDPCVFPSYGVLEPNMSTQRTWIGNALTELDLTEACAPAEDCPETCMRREQAPAGTHTIAVTVYRTCTVGACTCGEPEGCGGADPDFGDPVELTATVEYPTQTSVELVYGD
jgi:hypothetical protein